jgi:hypothetical protein
MPTVAGVLAASALIASASAGVAIRSQVAGAARASAAVTAPALREACPQPAIPLQERCQLLAGPGEPAVPAGGAADGVLTRPLLPGDLRAAYGLASASASRGAGETVAVVVAYHDPYVASDLVRYRQLYGLGTCSAAAGTRCFTVLNQAGQPSPLPSGTAAGWEDESALDVEMVAAICPRCRIILLEANSASLADLGAAENSAARVARFICNSWSGIDFPGESAYDSQYFNHPGVAITFASGDNGYAAAYPASSQLVTAVGGTYLDRDAAGGWHEATWSGQSKGPGKGTGTQSGCSSGEPKPAWQSDPGCSNRTENDVAAVADAPDGVEYYSSASACGGLCQAYGTSIGAAIIAAVYALAGTPEDGTYPAQYPYLHTSALHRVLSGADGNCEPGRRYLCDAAGSLGDGYNGPAGWGTPDGTAAFAPPRSGTVVSVINPGAYDLQAGLFYRLPAITAYDSDSGQRLSYSATGLPAGLSVSPSSGVISGTLPSAPRTASVVVTVRDGAGARARVSFKIVAVRSLDTGYQAGQGQVSLAAGGLCLDDRGGQLRRGNPVQAWRCLNDQAQQWAFRPAGEPGDPGELIWDHWCLDITGRATTAGSPVALWPCTGSGNQRWSVTGAGGEVYNPASRMCLNVPAGGLAGSQLDIAPCTGAPAQEWILPASPIVSGVVGRCLDLGGGRAAGTPVIIGKCDGSAAEKFRLGPDGTVQSGGMCLNVTANSATDGSGVRLSACDRAANEIFQFAAYGMIENPGSGKCLADPGDSTASGTRVVLEDCYGLPGEVWAAGLRQWPSGSGPRASTVRIANVERASVTGAIARIWSSSTCS